MTTSNSKHSNALYVLTGLADSELADVLAANPRAYMAVKGAVAEKHLENILGELRSRGQISSFRQGKGDFEKDFYVTLKKGKRDLIIECKNVEVIKESTREDKAAYIQFLSAEGCLNEDSISQWLTKGALSAEEAIRILRNLSKASTQELVSFRNSLPVHLRESGLPRYKFSVSLLKKNLALTKESAREG